MLNKLEKENKIVGTKQVIRCLKNDKIELIYLAKDARGKNIDLIKKIAKDEEIEIFEVESMKKLGKICDIDVNAAVAALLK